MLDLEDGWSTKWLGRGGGGLAGRVGCGVEDLDEEGLSVEALGLVLSSCLSFASIKAILSSVLLQSSR